MLSGGERSRKNWLQRSKPQGAWGKDPPRGQGKGNPVPPPEIAMRINKPVRKRSIVKHGTLCYKWSCCRFNLVFLGGVVSTPCQFIFFNQCNSAFALSPPFPSILETRLVEAKTAVYSAWCSGLMS